MKRIGLAMLLASLSLVLIPACGKEARPQYVILILMDAVRPDHVGCYGYHRDTTPRIDDLARSGLVFDDAVAQAPWTLPSVATILSSTFPSQHGAKRVEGRNVAMKDLETTFVELLGNEGYRTCSMSTAKIFRPELGLSQGFRESYVAGQGPNVLEKVAAMELTEASAAWLRQHKKEKCFLFIHHYDTHYPYKAEEGCTDRFNPGYEGPYRFRFGDSSLRILKAARAGRLEDAVSLTDADINQVKTLYDCELVRTDTAIGRLVDSLAAWGCLEKSLIIISADHGEEFLERGSLDHGQTVFDESIRVPLVMYCPAVITSSGRIDAQVGLIDLGPTILDVLGFEVPQAFEGVSLLPLMTGGEYASGRQFRACGLPTACLVAEALAHRPEKKALRCPPWKLVFDPFFGADQLYNLAEDPGETSNLLETEPEMAANLTDILLTSMEAYYPGGWCIAWRAGGGTDIEGTVKVGGGLIEVIAHNLFPTFDPHLDSLATSGDRREVHFRSRLEDRWEGVEIRMPSRQKAGLDISIDGRRDADVLIGGRTRHLTFPTELTPGEAEIDRDNLHRLFRQDGADLVVFWVDPGSEPTAMDEKQEELRRKLKAIGYIE
jgi:choline-sulfatase